MTIAADKADADRPKLFSRWLRGPAWLALVFAVIGILLMLLIPDGRADAKEVLATGTKATVEDARIYVSPASSRQERQGETTKRIELQVRTGDGKTLFGDAGPGLRPLSLSGSELGWHDDFGGRSDLVGRQVLFVEGVPPTFEDPATLRRDADPGWWTAGHIAGVATIGFGLLLSLLVLVAVDLLSRVSRARTIRPRADGDFSAAKPLTPLRLAVDSLVGLASLAMLAGGAYLLLAVPGQGSAEDRAFLDAAQPATLVDATALVRDGLYPQDVELRVRTADGTERTVPARNTGWLGSWGSEAESGARTNAFAFVPQLRDEPVLVTDGATGRADFRQAVEGATSSRNVVSLVFGGILLVLGLVLGAVEARQLMRRSRPAGA